MSYDLLIKGGRLRQFESGLATQQSHIRRSIFLVSGSLSHNVLLDGSQSRAAYSRAPDTPALSPRFLLSQRVFLTLKKIFWRLGCRGVDRGGNL